MGDTNISSSFFDKRQPLIKKQTKDEEYVQNCGKKKVELLTFKHQLLIGLSIAFSVSEAGNLFFFLSHVFFSLSLFNKSV